ncbi:hypothetical protein [Eleftheria terrae]|uniref:hypothetical protein n=1 Tax=Eleftheria terrae TaxID=1597781 RepID=UPI00263AC6C1|nr:hypothetical protein [Eleftheria terrae]WKB50860.1 hypothetical protein N7L95_13665 [Eleftheria terrae]
MPTTSPDPVDRRRLRDLRPVADLRHRRHRIANPKELDRRHLLALGLIQVAEALAATPSSAYHLDSN